METETSKNRTKTSKNRTNVPKIPKIPKWLLQRDGITTRQWKAEKRRELKAVLDAWETYSSGSAYCPGYNHEEHADVVQALIKLRDALSVKNWGR